MKVNLSDVFDGLAKLRRAAQDQTPLFNALKKPMKDDQRNHQKLKMGPDGPWAPRKESTNNRGRFARRGSSGRVVRKRIAANQLGKLSTSVTFAPAARRITAVSKIPWSQIHQEGGKVGRGAVLPARPFLWMSVEFLNLAMKQIGDRVIASYGVK